MEILITCVMPSRRYYGMIPVGIGVIALFWLVQKDIISWSDPLAGLVKAEVTKEEQVHRGRAELGRRSELVVGGSILSVI